MIFDRGSGGGGQQRHRQPEKLATNIGCEEFQGSPHSARVGPPCTIQTEQSGTSKLLEDSYYFIKRLALWANKMKTVRSYLPYNG
jgi:hypothetical protein